VAKSTATKTCEFFLFFLFFSYFFPLLFCGGGRRLRDISRELRIDCGAGWRAKEAMRFLFFFSFPLSFPSFSGINIWAALRTDTVELEGEHV